MNEQLQLTLTFATGDLLSVSLVRYKLQDTIAYFCGPSSLTFSDKSAILKLKEGKNEIVTLRMMFKKVITFKYEKISVTGSL